MTQAYPTAADATVNPNTSGPVAFRKRIFCPRDADALEMQPSAEVPERHPDHACQPGQNRPRQQIRKNDSDLGMPGGGDLRIGGRNDERRRRFFHHRSIARGRVESPVLAVPGPKGKTGRSEAFSATGLLNATSERSTVTTEAVAIGNVTMTPRAAHDAAQRV